jgi:hypothetical protein
MANTTTTKTVSWKNGLSIIHAGTPLDTNGKVVMDNTAVGIVAEDVQMPDTTATVITAGEWDESVNAPYFHITDEVKLKLSDITFTPPPAVPLSAYVLKTDLATTEAAGVVLQAEAVEDLTDAPTAEDFNGLLGALRDAGIVNVPEEDPEEENT